MEGLARRAGVVRVIERTAVRLDGRGAQCAVIEHTLHAVAVARVPGDAQQVAGHVEMRVGAAGRFEALAKTDQPAPKPAASGRREVCARPPGARSKALRAEKIKTA